MQQKLMPHAQISTTMDVYGNALITAKHQANSKVVRMALGMHTHQGNRAAKNPETPIAFGQALLYGVIWGWPCG
jgi:hypothetical protein